MPKVNMSPFICKELVYDYLIGSLSVERREKFQEFLAEDEELRRRVEMYKHALQYTGELKKIELSEEYLFVFDRFLDKEEKPKTVLKNIKEKKEKVSEKQEEKSFEIDKKLDSIKSFLHNTRKNPYFKKTIEAFSVGLLIIVIMKSIPENFFQSDFWESKNTSVIRQEDVQKKIDHDASLENSSIASNEAVLDEEVDLDKESLRVNDTKAVGLDPNLVAIAESTGAEEEMHLEPSSAPKPSATPDKNSSNEKIKKESFYLYRSIIYVDDMESVSLAFSAFLSERGATKAGNVKLGWEKPGARYFHFHIDEKFNEPMVQFLGPYGQLQLDKVEHWRKVPENKMRVIIEIRQKGQ